MLDLPRLHAALSAAIDNLVDELMDGLPLPAPDTHDLSHPTPPNGTQQSSSPDEPHTEEHTLNECPSENDIPSDTEPSNDDDNDIEDDRSGSHETDETGEHWLADNELADCEPANCEPPDCEPVDVGSMDADFEDYTSVGEQPQAAMLKERVLQVAGERPLGATANDFEDALGIGLLPIFELLRELMNEGRLQRVVRGIDELPLYSLPRDAVDS